MEKEFVPYEQALELKQLGFDEECFSYYTYPEGKFSNVLSFNSYKNTALKTSSPTFSQAFRWFREKYKLYCEIRTFVWSYDNNKLGFNITTYLNPLSTETSKVMHPQVYESYEEAELACLIKLIEIVKK